MRLQLARAFHHQLHIPVQLAQHLADRARLLAHARILQNGPHRVQRRHAGCRRHDPHPRRKPFAHQFGEIRMQLGINRLRRQEHQRPIGGFALQNVFLGNRLDMAAHRHTHLLGRLIHLPIRIRPPQRLIRLQRKLRIDHNRPRRVRQMDQTIRPLPIRQRRLQRIAVRRQRLGHDIGQLDLPERAARLLVRQNILKAQHIARQLGDVVLRLVDGRKPLLQLAQRRRRLFRRPMQALLHPLLHLGQRPVLPHRIIGQPVLHPLLHIRQPPLHRLDHLGLRIGLRVADRLDVAAQGLLPRTQLLHMAAQHTQLLRQRLRQPRRPPRRPHRHDQQHKEHQNNPGPDQNRQNHRIAERICLPANLDHVRPNSLSISLSFNST